MGYPPGLVPGAINPILDGVLKSLPKKISSQEDKSHYDRFISSFGTHYVVAANMGGKVNHDVYVDSSYYKTQSQSYISAQISLTFHYDLWDINPAHGYMNKS